VKTPLLRRRGLWIALGTLTVVAIVAGIGYGLVQERNDRRDRERVERMAGAVNDYRGEIEPILASIGSAVPPSSFNAFPSLGASIDALRSPEVDQSGLDEAATEADASTASAKSAAGLFDEVVVTDLVADRGFSGDFILYVINSQDGFVRSMNLYRQAALLTALAADTEEGATRDDLAARASDVYDLAVETLVRAYGDYVQAQVLAGVFQTTPGGLTGSLLTGATG
jgi:hypothetical protein